MPGGYLAGLSVQERESSWRDLLTRPEADLRVWLVELDERLVGFAATALPHDRGHLPLTAELQGIYLLEDAVGRGVGRSIPILDSGQRVHAGLGAERIPVSIWLDVGGESAESRRGALGCSLSMATARSCITASDPLECAT
jgi:hypothetical protein